MLCNLYMCVLDLLTNQKITKRMRPVISSQTVNTKQMHSELSSMTEILRKQI